MCARMIPTLQFSLAETSFGLGISVRSWLVRFDRERLAEVVGEFLDDVNRAVRFASLYVAKVDVANADQWRELSLRQPEGLAILSDPLAECSSHGCPNARNRRRTWPRVLIGM